MPKDNSATGAPAAKSEAVAEGDFFTVRNLGFFSAHRERRRAGCHATVGQDMTK
jgi:hypothetical protein